MSKNIKMKYLAALLGAFMVVGCSSSDDKAVSKDGNFRGTTIISDTQGFFWSYKDAGNVNLFEFNPSTGVIMGSASGYTSADIRDVALSPEGMLWVGLGDETAPQIEIIDPASRALIDTIPTTKNPDQIVFSGSTSGTDCDYCAVIKGVAADYSSSDVSIADAESPYTITEGYAAQDLSDIAVAVNGSDFYRIGRWQQDNITKYEFDNPSLEQWQFTLKDSASEPSNPYDIIFVSDTKAYVIRYGESTIWVVDPSVLAANEAGFKTAEIDISSYDADGVPNVAAGLIHNGRLYIVMQALDASYVPGQAYLAAFDTTTDAEIDLDASVTLGMPLEVRNPVDIDVQGDFLFVTGQGRYASSWAGTPAEYTGGIEKISLTDFSAELLIDDN